MHTGVLGSATPDQDSRILATSSEFCSCLNKRSDNTSDVTCAERWIIGFEDGIPFSPKVQLNELAKILRWIKEEQTWKDSWQFVVAVVMAWSCSTLVGGNQLVCYPATGDNINFISGNFYCCCVDSTSHAERQRYPEIICRQITLRGIIGEVWHLHCAVVKGRRGNSRCWTNIHINGIFLNICQKSFCFLLCNNSRTTMPQSPGGRSWRDKGEKMIDSRGKILDGWLSLWEIDIGESHHRRKPQGNETWMK